MISTKVTPTLRSLIGLLLLLVPLSGCQEYVPSDYGRMSAYPNTSLNGTRVLGRMFTEAGHKVRSWYYLSPALERADVIVWFPDDFEAPTYEVEAWLNYWLVEGDASKDPRLLIIVGRDFDAAPDYWTRMQGSAPANLQKEYARRLTEAKTEAARERPKKLSDDSTASWFSLDETRKQKTVGTLTGPWAEGIDSSKAEVVRHTRMNPLDKEYKTLLSDGLGDPLVFEKKITYQNNYGDYSDFEFNNYDYYSSGEGRLIMVENGSWLLNARLVNKEHRKLAGQLIDAVGPAPKRVVFLESGAGGPPIRSEDPDAEIPTGFQLFRVWPLGAVLTQIAALGIIYAVMKWPIFGIPRTWLQDRSSEFASHIAALGDLLASGRNRSYAIRLLILYRQALRRDQAPMTEMTHSAGPLPAPLPDPPASE